MADNAVTQRVAAILAADAVGYSRLMAADEPATIDALDAARAVFIENIESNQGRVVDTAGDSVLAVFETTEGAAVAAAAIQARLAEINAAVEPERRMPFRIGLHLGDIREKADGTVYGDGVNVAARLEGLAEPGRIVVSGSVHDSIRGRHGLQYHFLGEQAVKNIAEPVRAYLVLAEGETAPVAPKRRRLILAGAAVALLALVVAFLWPADHHESLPEVATAEPEDPILALPTGPSIAVLPFDNMSGDPEQEYFADGIVEDILTRLSRFSNLRVIGRNSTFQYKGQAVDARTVGRDLGAAYVLEGSVRRSADRIKVAVQLLDATDGSHVWANEYERDLEAAGVFEIQAEIAASVAGRLGGGYGEIAQEHRRLESYVAPDNLTSYECILRLYEYWMIFTPEKHEEVRDCLEFAVEAEPTYAEAWAGLTWIYADEFRFGYNTLPDSIQRSLDAGLKAVSLDPGSVMAHWTLAITYFNTQELDSFFDYADRALELNPNDPVTLAALGEKMVYAGYLERGVALVNKAASLNPNHPKWYFFSISFASYQNREYEAAATFAEKIDIPGFFWTHAYRAATYAQIGQKEKAQAALRELLTLYPDFREKWSQE
jgi:adenylate cyclase